MSMHRQIVSFAQMEEDIRAQERAQDEHEMEIMTCMYVCMYPANDMVRNTVIYIMHIAGLNTPLLECAPP